MVPREFLLRVAVPIYLAAFGTLGYHLIEGWGWFDSLYMTVITLTTVGYGETHPLSPTGRAFTMVLLVSGVFTLFYFATDAIRAVASGELAATLERRKMEKVLKLLKNHVIVCGCGRMGRLVAREFSRQKVPFVLIDADANALGDFDLPHGVALVGDATSDDTLREAGIDRARSLVAAMSSDATNLFATMSARLLNPKLFIVARVEDANAEEKLRRAGANRTVSPYQIGGGRVAMAVLRPTVVDFIELATRTEHIDLQLEETRISADSPLVGATLRASKLRDELKIIIVAIKKGAGRMVFNPDAEETLAVDDVLVAIGDRANLDRMERLAQGPKPE